MSPRSDNEVSLRDRALRILARREHSRTELAAKLARYCEDSAEIDTLLATLCEEGWLSDNRYAEQMVRHRNGQFGTRRIRQELREKGVASEIIDAELNAVMHDDLAVARALWQRKFGQLPDSDKEKARQVRFLQSRGFGYDVILKILRNLEDE
ncbi:recombination regulator RecX [Chitinivorax sp. B]|uniref:recombination regulator RecX n=1 Tax=Chitinivorax sp. B TaxID=2502235 RepID=UPI0010F92FE6|nr:recombination regulator RecX [Chitinivorax sp. B]